MRKLVFFLCAFLSKKLTLLYEDPSKLEEYLKASVDDGEKVFFFDRSVFLQIPEGRRLYCIIGNNLPFIKKLQSRIKIPLVRGILIFKNKDYFSKLSFPDGITDGGTTGGGTTGGGTERKDETTLRKDETGFFEGVKVDSFDDILERGKLLKTGFFHDYSHKEEEEEYVRSMKILVYEISKERGMTLHQLINEDCRMSLVDQIIFDSLGFKKEEELTVCVCEEEDCKEKCSGKYKVEKRNLI